MRLRAHRPGGPNRYWAERQRPRGRYRRRGPWTARRLVAASMALSRRCIDSRWWLTDRGLRRPRHPSLRGAGQDQRARDRDAVARGPRAQGARDHRRCDLLSWPFTVELMVSSTMGPARTGPFTVGRTAAISATLFSRCPLRAGSPLGWER